MSAKKRHAMEAAAREMEQWGDRPVILEMDITTAVVMCGALQLALRHPDFAKQKSADAVRTLVFDIAEQISGEEYPAIQELIKMGFHSRFDG